MQIRVRASSTHGSKNGIATRIGNVAGTSVKARSAPISRYEIDAIQKDADSAFAQLALDRLALEEIQIEGAGRNRHPEREEAVAHGPVVDHTSGRSSSPT